jgi:uncharacterized protein YjbI with pentapeptide repeats
MSETEPPASRQRGWFARLERKVAAIVAWAEISPVMKLPKVLGQLSVLVVAITYVTDAPKRRQIVIDEALKSIQSAETEPFSDARRRGLLLLKDYCVSAAGLRMKHADLPGIDLSPCDTGSYRPTFDWKPYRSETMPFDLSHAVLAHANLRGADFTRVRLDGADLQGADLRGANLQGASLDNADLTGADLRGADLTGASLRATRLAKANLDGANLTRADASHCELTDAHAVHTNFEDANLSNAALVNADLAGADLDHAILYRADLTGIRLNHSSLEGTMVLGSTPEGTAVRTNGSQRAFRIALLTIDPSDGFFVDVEAGFRDFLAKPSIQGIRQGTLAAVRATYHRLDLEKQEVASLLQDDIDAIVLSPVHDKLSRPTIQEVYDAGIVVVCYNSCGERSDLNSYYAGRFESDQVALGHLTGAHLAAAMAHDARGKVLDLGILHCGANEESCYRRYLGFQTALNEAGIVSRLTGSREGWNSLNAPRAAERLLADDPDVDILWAANNAGTEAIARVAAGVHRNIYVAGTDMTPEIQQLLQKPGPNPLRAVAGQSPRIMGYCAAAAALADLHRLSAATLPEQCRGAIPVRLHTHS